MLARMLGGVGRTLITAGTLILLFVAYQLWGTGLQEAQAQEKLGNEFEEVLEQQEPLPATTTTAPPTTTTAPPTDGGMQVVPREAPKAVAPVEGYLPEIGDPVAEIRIPKIGVSRTVVEGANLRQLKRGPAHYEETPFPGQAGNAAIAGHRTTYGQPFHNVDKLGPGDLIEVKTAQGEFTYEIDKVHVVTPDQVEVLLPTKDAKGQLENRITLTACEPKWSAAKRIIVTGLLVGEPMPPIKGQDEARANADTSGRDDTDGAAMTIDGGLSGQSASKTPAILWGLACALVWLLTWLAQVLLRRLVRRRAETAAAATEADTAEAPTAAAAASTDDDIWTTAAADVAPTTRPVKVKPSRSARLLTWSPYLVGLPVFLVTLYVFFENFALLLPGNY